MNFRSRTIGSNSIAAIAPSTHSGFCLSDVLCLALLTILLAFSFGALLLKYPPPGGDEPVIVDPAVNLVRHGYLGTNLYSGLVPGIERHYFLYPPFYFVALAGWFKLFGVGLLQARAFSLLCTGLIVWIVYLFARRYVSPRPAFASAALCALTIWVVLASRVARMDSLCVALIMTAAILYEGADRTERLVNYALSGFAAGLAAITHPLGIVAATAIGLHMILRFRARIVLSPAAYVWFFPFAVCELAWLAYIVADPGSFGAQMSLQIARKMLWRYAYSYQFWMARTHAATLALALFAAGWCCTKAWREPSYRFLAILGIVSFAAATYGREASYFLYFIPVCFVMLALVLQYGGALQRVTFAMFALALVNESVGWTKDFVLHHNDSYVVFASELRTLIPPGAPVLELSASNAATTYFALLDRNPITQIPPVPLDPQKTAAVMRTQEYVVTGYPIEGPNKGIFADRKLIAVTGHGFNFYLYAPREN